MSAKRVPLRTAKLHSSTTSIQSLSHIARGRPHQKLGDDDDSTQRDEMILPPQVPIIMHNRADSTMNNMEEIMDRLNIVFQGDRHEG